MISTDTSRNSYTGNGSTTVFAYTFKIFASADLKVYVGTVLKTLTTDYTVSGVGTSGGNVTFVSAPANASKIEIFRSVALQQLTDYIENDNFPAATHEDTLDKIVQQIQMIKDTLRRVPKWAIGTNESVDLALGAANANFSLVWNANGDSINAGVVATSRVQVYRAGTNQTITPGSNKIQLNSTASISYVDYLNTLNEFDNVTNFRFVPSVAGGYLVAANAAFPYIANAGRVFLYINKSGAATVAGQHTSITNIPSSGRASISAIVQLATSDYLELWVNNETLGGNTEAVINVTKMEIIRLW